MQPILLLLQILRGVTSEMQHNITQHKHNTAQHNLQFVSLGLIGESTDKNSINSENAESARKHHSMLFWTPEKVQVL